MTSRPTPPPDNAELIARDRADWLLDAVATSTQDRRFLRGDPEYDDNAGRAILLSGAKAIKTAIEALSQPRPDGDVPQLTAEEEAELVERINANPNLHPLPDGDVVERVARAIAPFMVRGLEGCSAAFDYPLLPDKERNRVLAAATAAVDASAIGRMRAENERLREALIQTATSLNAMIECVGFPMKSRTHYRWARFPTFDEVQVAMEANNNARAALKQEEANHE